MAVIDFGDGKKDGDKMQVIFWANTDLPRPGSSPPGAAQPGSGVVGTAALPACWRIKHTPYTYSQPTL